MAFFTAVVVGLSLVFAGLILAIAAELYYLIRWKKPLTAREIDEANTSYAHELLDLLSMRQQQASSLHLSTAFQPSRSPTRSLSNLHESDPEMGSSRSLLDHQESVEFDLMRLHNLAGPPRFLFTIAEETKEDLDSEDGRSRGDRSRKGSRNRSLSDVMTPFLTPIASPRITSPALNNPSLDSYTPQAFFNPLYEATSFEEIEARLRQSPPPKFKFLRDAEEKLYRRMKELRLAASAQSSAAVNTPCSTVEEGQIGSLITLIAAGKKDREVPALHHSSASSKILPLASSPTRFRLEAT